MENSNSSNLGTVIGALLIGIAAGAAVGILFAPEKGSKTRSNLLSSAKGLAKDLRNKIVDEVDALRKKADELESLAKEQVDNYTGNSSKGQRSESTAYHN